MPLTNLSVYTLLAVLLLGVSACSVLPERQQLAVQYYGLPLSFDSFTSDAASSDILMLARPLANKAYATQQMAFRRDRAEVSYYQESRWVDEPAQLLVSELQRALEQQGLFRAVIPQGTPITAQWRLELELLEFIQDYSLSQPVFAVQLRVRLVDVNRRTVAATELMRVREPITSENAQGGVAAAVAANSALLDEVVRFVASSLPDTNR